MNRVDAVLSRMDRAVGLLSGLAVAIGAIAVAGMVFMVTAYIIVREFLKGQWFFVEEWSGYLLVLLVYWSCAYTLRSGGHINVGVVVRFLPKRARLWMAALTSLAALGMLGFFMEKSIRWVIYAAEESLVSGFPSLTPMWIPFTFVSIGLGVFSLAMALHLARKVVEAVRGKVEEEEVVGPPI